MPLEWYHFGNECPNMPTHPAFVISYSGADHMAGKVSPRALVQIHRFGDSFLSFRLEFGPRSLLTLLNLQKKLQIRYPIQLKIWKLQTKLVRFKKEIGSKFDQEVGQFSV